MAPDAAANCVKVDVLIAGAGFSGLGMAIQLRRKMPEVTFLIVEKGRDMAAPGMRIITPAVRAISRPISIRFLSKKVLSGRACSRGRRKFKTI
jgi:cation diffusion facilitator CzcD-associated flavoprotein CzcO